MKCSICLATKDKAMYLDRTLASIRKQDVPFEYEIIVTDDGSVDNTRIVCERWDVDKYKYLKNLKYRNPSVARNVAYRQAKGDIIIAQSDDTMHGGPDVIKKLCNRLHKKEFLIATVYNYDVIRAEKGMLYTGIEWQRPFFFLGSLWRKDLYAVGGNDEEFVAPAFDDDWFGDCLTKGLKLRARYMKDIIGYHQDHARPRNLAKIVIPSEKLYEEKVSKAEIGAIPWCASGGPWCLQE